MNKFGAHFGNDVFSSFGSLAWYSHDTSCVEGLSGHAEVMSGVTLHMDCMEMWEAWQGVACPFLCKPGRHAAALQVKHLWESQPK